MSRRESGVVRKKLDDKLIASIRLTIQKREELNPVFDKLQQQCKEYICGPALAIHHWGTGVQGSDVEIAFPITQNIETDEAKTRILEGAETLTILHHGSYEKLGESYEKLYGHMRERGIPSALTAREVYLEFRPDNPQDNVIEIQAIMHDWNDRFAENLDRVLGARVREKVLKGVDAITPESNMDERFEWIKASIERLDKLADDEQKFEILSQCAHVFPIERIQRLRAVYEEKRDIDEVLRAMHKDPSWYSTPTREGNIIRIQKVPYDKEAYESAKDDDEKKRAYCHCPMIRNFLDQIPSTFCYCGTGWPRRLWEGIIGKPVRVEIIKSLPKGDDFCEFAVHLPLDKS